MLRLCPDLILAMILLKSYLVFPVAICQVLPGLFQILLHSPEEFFG